MRNAGFYRRSRSRNSNSGARRSRGLSPAHLTRHLGLCAPAQCLACPAQLLVSSDDQGHDCITAQYNRAVGTVKSHAAPTRIMLRKASNDSNDTDQPQSGTPWNGRSTKGPHRLRRS